ncbi:MAG: response regulator [Chloroflexota bacterium]
MTVLQGKRVFCFEDDAKNRSIVETILQASGATIRFDSWGFVEISLPKIRVFQPDVILLDLMLMGNVSGYDVYDLLRSKANFATVPIVAVSASDPAFEIPKARKMGFAGFIGKPIDIHLFPNQIASIIRGETVWYVI